jgi:hypothetical protein
MTQTDITRGRTPFGTLHDQLVASGLSYDDAEKMICDVVRNAIVAATNVVGERITPVTAHHIQALEQVRAFAGQAWQS